MWTAVLAPIGVVVGVLLGVWLEPIKLRAAHKARLRQERLDRSAQLVEAANEVRGLGVDLGRAHHGIPPEHGDLGERDIAALTDRFHKERAKVRTTAQVLCILGPDDLAEKADAVREAGAVLAEARRLQGEPNLVKFGARPPMPRAVASAV